MGLELSFAERRVLGVLMEKAFTTPDQYPLSVNALAAASNQKSCRDPITEFGDEEVIDALDSLREKGLVVVAMGSRVDRYSHCVSRELDLHGAELAVLAELLLRGPQTDGELRQRARRMVPIESLEALREVIERLSSRPEPLVTRLGAEGRQRGVKYAHTLYPEGERPSPERPEPEVAPRPAAQSELARLRSDVEALKVRLSEIETLLKRHPQAG